MSSPDPAKRLDLRAAIQRDTSRRARREVGHQSFWRSLGLLGMVGWPIALTSVGGAVLGHYFDETFRTGVRYTLLLLMIGTAIGSSIAWKTLGSQKR